MAHHRSAPITRISPHIEGHITTDLFHYLTGYNVSNERLDALINDGTIDAFRVGGQVILDIGSVRRWLFTVHPDTFESIKTELF